jgi:hypothetical protein
MRGQRHARARSRLVGYVAYGVPPESGGVPTNVILVEDGVEMLAEDGEYLVWSDD